MTARKQRWSREELLALIQREIRLNESAKWTEAQLAEVQQIQDRLAAAKLRATIRDEIARDNEKASAALDQVIQKQSGHTGYPVDCATERVDLGAEKHDAGARGVVSVGALKGSDLESVAEFLHRFVQLFTEFQQFATVHAAEASPANSGQVSK